MMRTLFLNPPSYEGFDGGAGARYQARREIRSYWYPTWLAQPAAIVPHSLLVDAAPAGRTLADVTPLARRHDLAVLHTSSPTFAGDIKVAEALKAENPSLLVGFVGPKVAVQPERSLLASAAIDFVAREEFDFTIAEVADERPLACVDGISYRDTGGQLVHNRDRRMLEDMDRLPFVTPVYKRDLRPEDYFIGYLLHPCLSLYTGRGCRSRCTFCLWPQTVGGHRYRTRSVASVLAEAALAARLFPQVQEVFFDDDTFTDDRPRAESIARGMSRLGITWSCNAKANVPRETLKVLADNGLRLLLVGYESGSQQILNNVRKGLRVDRARRFARDCRDLGITVHGTFILGLPGETRKPSRRRSASPGRSTRTRSRSRSRRPIPAPSCTSGPGRTAGCPTMTTAPPWSASTAPRWRRCPTRTWGTPRSSNRWTRSTSGSTSGPGSWPSCRPSCSGGPT